MLHTLLLESCTVLLIIKPVLVLAHNYYFFVAFSFHSLSVNYCIFEACLGLA